MPGLTRHPLDSGTSAGVTFLVLTTANKTQDFLFEKALLLPCQIDHKVMNCPADGFDTLSQRSGSSHPHTQPVNVRGARQLKNTD